MEVKLSPQVLLKLVGSDSNLADLGSKRWVVTGVLENALR